MQSGIEALHVADLQDLAARSNQVLQTLDLLHRHPERLLAQDVLAGFKGLRDGGDVKRVGSCDDDGLDLTVGKHRIVVAEGFCRLMGRGHTLAQVVGHVADGVEFGVPRLDGALEMGGLGNRATAQDSNLQTPGCSLHVASRLPRR
jgi:hypothetical protein